MIELLQKVPLFSKLDENQLLHLSGYCVRRFYKAGTVLCREKDVGTEFYVLVTGSVKIYTTGSNGDEKILTLLNDTDSFGELSLLDGKPRSASAMTLTDSVILALTKSDFIDVLQAHFDITIAIMQELCQRLRDTNQHVHDLTFLDARTRILKSLLQMTNKNGKRVGNLITLKVALNYDELAQLAGVHKSELMQVLRDMQMKQLLYVGNDDFTLDLSKLRG